MKARKPLISHIPAGGLAGHDPVRAQHGAPLIPTRLTVLGGVCASGTLVAASMAMHLMLESILERASRELVSGILPLLTDELQEPEVSTPGEGLTADVEFFQIAKDLYV